MIITCEFKTMKITITRCPKKLYADYMDSGQWFMRRRFSKLHVFAIYMYINLYKTKSLWGGPYITPKNLSAHT